VTTSDPLMAALTGQPWQPEAPPANGNGHAPADPLNYTDLTAHMGGTRARPPIHENLIYPGKLHCIGGEPGHGKSTLCLWLLLAAVRRGHPVAMFDWEAGAEHTGDLLTSFGVPAAAVSACLHYFRRPAITWDSDGIEFVMRRLERIRPVIALFDSSIAVLSAMGGRENEPTDTRRMWDTLALICERTGTAALATDHSGKDAAESRYNRGSSDKLAAVDVSAKLTATQQFSRSRDGRLHLTVTKDRPGWLHWEWDITVTRGPLTLDWRATGTPPAAGGGGAAAALAGVLTAAPADIGALVDAIVAAGGYPLKYATARKTLAEMADAGQCQRHPQGAGRPVLWSLPAAPAPVTPGSDGAMKWGWEDD